MKVTLVTPSLNQARYLGRTLNSVFAQEGDYDLEYIVADGGSNDGSLDLLHAAESKRFACRRGEFRWVSRKDLGQANALNREFRHATGDVVGFVNSDDTLCPNALQSVVNAFRGDPNARWVTGYCRIIDENDVEVQRLVAFYKRYWLKRFSRRTLLVLNYVAQPATFWRRDVIAEVGEFEESLNLAFDYEYCLRLARLTSPIIIHEELAAFRVHGLSKGGRRLREQFAEDLQVARSAGTSRVQLLAHSVHNALIVNVYRLFR